MILAIEPQQDSFIVLQNNGIIWQFFKDSVESRLLHLAFPVFMFRLKRRLSQRKVAPTRVVKTFVTPIAQRYQKVLETSVHRLSNVLADSAAPGKFTRLDKLLVGCLNKYMYHHSIKLHITLSMSASSALVDMSRLGVGRCSDRGHCNAYQPASFHLETFCFPSMDY